MVDIDVSDPHLVASYARNAEISEENLVAMWRTTSVFHEQHWLAVQDIEPTERQQRKWQGMVERFLENPRYWHVADCEECEWSSGGWLTQYNADRALKDHADATHMAKGSKK